MKIAVQSIILFALAQPAFAQDFTGSEFAVEYNQFTDDDGDGGANLFANTEIALSTDLALGMSLAQYDFENKDSAATFHAIYHGFDVATLGAFVSATDDDVTSFGLETNAFVLGGVFEGYIGARTVDADDFIIAGANTDGPLGNSRLSIFTDFDVVANEDRSVLTNEFGIAYAFDRGPDVFAQLGRITETAGAVTTNFDYIGIGAEIQLNTSRGVSFGIR